MISLVLLSACTHYGAGEPVRLQWTGVEAMPEASATVAMAFSTSPFVFGLRDARPDPAVVGGYADSRAVVQTPDNVGQYCSTRLGELLRHAGAHLGASPMVLEAELLD